jgi:hypothetical protein
MKALPELEELSKFESENKNESSKFSSILFPNTNITTSPVYEHVWETESLEDSEERRETEGDLIKYIFSTDSTLKSISKSIASPLLYPICFRVLFRLFIIFFKLVNLILKMLLYFF